MVGNMEVKGEVDGKGLPAVVILKLSSTAHGVSGSWISH